MPVSKACFTVKQSDLKRALSDVDSAVAARATLPVLGNICLVATTDQLVVSATNMEISITSTIPGKPFPADVAYPLNITVPGHLLVNTINALPEGEVMLVQNEKKMELTVAVGRWATTLKGIAVTEFPELPTFDRALVQFDLSADILLDLVASVSSAASTDQARPVLTAIQLVLSPYADDPAQAELAAQAADGYRLARKTVALPRPRGADDPLSLLVPSKALAVFTRLANKLKGDTLRLGVTKHAIILKVENTTFTSLLLEGSFPDLKAVMPEASKQPLHVRMNCQEFIRALALANVIAAQVNHCVLLDIKPGDPSTVKLRAVSAESGENDSVLDCIEPVTKALAVAFSSDFLADAVGSIATDEFLLALSTPTSPGLISPVNDPNAKVVDCRYVMMPMQFNAKQEA